MRQKEEIELTGEEIGRLFRRGGLSVCVVGTALVGLLLLTAFFGDPFHLYHFGDATPLLILLGIGGFCAAGCAGFRAAIAQEQQNTFGTARFATAAALRRAELLSPKGRDRSGGHQLELGAWHNRVIAVSERMQYQHVILIAPTGMGKTSGVIVSGLLQEGGQRGLCVNDVKGELYSICAGVLSQRMPVSLFSPAQPEKSICYNPLAHVHSMEDAQDFAISWVDNTGVSREPYWNESAKLLITAVILHLRQVEPGAGLGRLADILSTASFDQVRQILSASKSQIARKIGGSFINNIGADPKLAAGLMSGLAVRFLLLNNPGLRRLTMTDPDPANNLDFKRLAETPGAFFLNIPASDARRLRPLTACLIMQLLDHLTRRGPGSRPFALYMDELCNAGRIPHYAEHISLVRGAGLALIQAIQDLGQLRALYGKDDAAAILANSTTKVFFPGMGVEEVEYASTLAGDTTVHNPSLSEYGGQQGMTISYAHRRLMTPDEVRRLEPGQLLVITSNIEPVVVQNLPYFERPHIFKLANLPVEPQPRVVG